MRRTTNAAKRLSGTARADRVRNEIAFASGAKCPSWLSKTAKAEWKRIADDLEANGLLTAANQHILATYCASFAHWKDSEVDIQTNGLVIVIESTTRTGMTKKPVPNPAVKNYLQFKRATLEAAKLFGLDPQSVLKVEAIPAPSDEDEEEADPLMQLLNS